MVFAGRREVRVVGRGDGIRGAWLVDAGVGRDTDLREVEVDGAGLPRWLFLWRKCLGFCPEFSLF